VGFKHAADTEQQQRSQLTMEKAKDKGRQARKAAQMKMRKYSQLLSMVDWG
jgi:hypothetical protein